MANSSDPYRRLGSNSWQELLDEVNDVLQNPEDGCDPLDTIDGPDEGHKWAKSDIREVHDRLNEMPGDCFIFQEIPDLWKVSIIDDIEEQLENAWCDCEDSGEVCCYDGCGSEEGSYDIIFLGTETVTPNDCTECDEDGYAACNDIRLNTYNPLVNAYLNGLKDWSEGLRKSCCLQNDLNKLNEELDKLNDELGALEQSKSDCQNGCVGEPACIMSCNNLYDPQIEDKETEISNKESEISTKESELASAQAQRDAGKGGVSGKCQEINDAVDSMVYCDYVAARDFLDDLDLSVPVPQGSFECPPPSNESSDNGPDGPQPCECGTQYFSPGTIWSCVSRYILKRRIYETASTACNGTPLTLFDSGFQQAGSGHFDPETGTPCHTDDSQDLGCTPFHLRYFCTSGCCCCPPEDNCGGTCCRVHPDNDRNYDWQLEAFIAGAGERVDQEGGPCGDGIIGGSIG